MRKKINDGLTNHQRYAIKKRNSDEYREYNRKYQAEWRKKNLEKSRLACRKYYASNRETLLLMAKEKFQEFKKSGYSDSHRLRQRLNKQKRRCSLDCENPLTTSQWLSLLKKSEGRCSSCGIGSDLTIDHIIPICKGGKHTLSNIQVLCRKCNSSKGGK